MKNYILKTSLVLATAALTFVSCSQEDSETVVSNDGKFLINLGEGKTVVETRAGLSSTAPTNLAIHIVSNYSQVADNTDGNSKSSKELLTTTYGIAAVEAEGKSAVTTSKEDGYARYWDDMHGRNSALSVYAIGVPGKDITADITESDNSKWKENKTISDIKNTTNNHDVDWTVSATGLTTSTIDDEDLIYTNNIKSTSCLRFSTTDGAFEKATGDKALQFKHALTRLTFNIKRGTGFATGTGVFQVSAFNLIGFNTAGTMDVSTGSWTGLTSNVNIDATGAKRTTATTDFDYTYILQVIPGTTMNDETTSDMVNITIDDNTYHITGKEIANAIKTTSGGDASFTALEEGKNYLINLTINKTSVDMSAMLADWNEVSADAEPKNARFQLSLSNGGTKTVNYDLYRLANVTTETSDNAKLYNWTTGYATDDNGKNVAGGSTQTTITDWYWPNNKTFYHFRSIAPTGTGVTTDATNGDFVAMQGGAVPATDGTGNDYIWGAPFAASANITSTTKAKDLYTQENGFSNPTITEGNITNDSKIFQAIGATENDIKMTQFHMMSKIQVDLETTDGTDKVDLTGATVKLANAYDAGKFLMSTGKISTTGTTGDVDLETKANSATTSTHSHLIIPQAKGDITLIVTVAGNDYRVSIPTTGDGTFFLPGQFYHYTLTIKKTGIAIAEAKLIDWNTVTGTISDVTLEK